MEHEVPFLFTGEQFGAFLRRFARRSHRRLNSSYPVGVPRVAASRNGLAADLSQRQPSDPIRIITIPLSFDARASRHCLASPQKHFSGVQYPPDYLEQFGRRRWSRSAPLGGVSPFPPPPLCLFPCTLKVTRRRASIVDSDSISRIEARAAKVRGTHA